MNGKGSYHTEDEDDEEVVADVEIPIDVSVIVKILVVGNAKCGKSSIIGQYITKSFDSKYKTTVGADFARKDLIWESPNKEKVGIRLQLWDIAGQDRFQKLTRAYFARAKGVVIVCDVSRDGTVDAVRTWKKEIDAWCEQSGCGEIPVVLFANKADLLKDAQDAFKTGATMEKMCREEGISGWWTTSALTGESLHEGFYTLLSKVMENHQSKNGKASDSRNSNHSDDVIRLNNSRANFEGDGSLGAWDVC